MNTKGNSSLAAALAGAAVLALAPSAKATPITWEANGHQYELFSSRGLSWSSASDAAIELGGHLVTVTSAAEESFVLNTVLGNFLYAVWAGGFQADQAPLSAGSTIEEARARASADWNWVTGEAWSYTNWKAGEPNDYSIEFGAFGGNEQYLAINWQPECKWNDEGANVRNIYGYVVEWGPLAKAAVPDAASTLSLFGLGLLGLMAVRRRLA